MNKGRCANCKNISWEVFDLVIAYCDITGKEISWPLFMGGSKKCECYERKVKTKNKFEYPKRTDSVKYPKITDSGMSPEDREIIEAYKRGETPASVLKNCQKK